MRHCIDIYSLRTVALCIAKITVSIDTGITLDHKAQKLEFHALHQLSCSLMSDFSPEIQLDKQIKTDEHVRHVTIRQIIGAERKHDSAPWKIEGREVAAVSRLS